MHSKCLSPLFFTQSGKFGIMFGVFLVLSLARPRSTLFWQQIALKAFNNFSCGLNLKRTSEGFSFPIPLRLTLESSASGRSFLNPQLAFKNNFSLSTLCNLYKDGGLSCPGSCPVWLRWLRFIVRCWTPLCTHNSQKRLCEYPFLRKTSLTHKYKFSFRIRWRVYKMVCGENKQTKMWSCVSKKKKVENMENRDELLPDEIVVPKEWWLHVCRKIRGRMQDFAQVCLHCSHTHWLQY